MLATDVPMALLDGRQRIIHVEAEPEFNEHGHGVGYTGIVQDVTDRRVAEDKIRHLANFDALTGLPNRRQLIWRAERALEQARRLGHQFALLLIDLDRFKIINDTLGHAAGDELLMEVAQRLRACVRHSDQVMEGALEAVGARSHRSLEAVGRLGGDEFVALLPEVADERDAERVAERILEVLREPIFVGGQECFVTASVGIAHLPARRRARWSTCCAIPTWRCTRSRSQGKNASAIYSPQLAGRGREKLELESALHKAIERDELVLHYQPKIDVRAARMVGAEALMRWQRGGAAGAAGRLHPAGRGDRADRAAVRMGAARGRAPGAAVAAQLRLRRVDRGEPAEPAVRAQRPGRAHPPVASRTYGVPHRMIQLEITETGLMKDLQNVIPSLHRLNEIGVEISIDDFGTGYSSLAYLTTLPICELKIDRSFVRDLGITPQSSARGHRHHRAGALAGPARDRPKAWRTLRQMEVLHRLGCGLMQGFLFSRAVAAGRPASAGWSRPCCRARRPGSASAGELDVGEAGAARRGRAGLTEQGPQSMDMSHRRSQLAARAMSPAQVAKAALRRLALAKLEPTPENYARAYARRRAVAAGLPTRRGRCCSADQRWRRSARRRGGRRADGRAAGAADESSPAAPGLGQAQDWSPVAAAGARLERGSRRGRGAPKESLQRVLDGSRSDAQRLLQRLRHAGGRLGSRATSPASTPARAGVDGAARVAAAAAAGPGVADAPRPDAVHGRLAAAWCSAWKAPCAPALPRDEPRAAELADATGGPGRSAWRRRAPRPSWRARPTDAVPARAPAVRAPPAPGRRAGRAVPRADRRA